MSIEDRHRLLRSHRRIPLCCPSSLPTSLDCGRDEIRRIIPHREPFLFVDSLKALDVQKNIIAGEFYLSPDIPLFKGHFPDFPVYPGCLQVEAIGQLGLCLVHFVANKVNSISEHASPPNIRATAIIGAYFRSEVRPRDTMTLIAKVVEYDAYFGILLGQTLVGGQVATAALMEVTFLD